MTRDLHKRAVSIATHEERRIAQGMPPGEMYDWARMVLGLEGRLAHEHALWEDAADRSIAAEDALARVRALLPTNPELIEAGYAVPAEDILAALKGA